jgi:hypothetical protein
VLSNASETWPLSGKDERLLSIFERRIFRRIFRSAEENWTRRNRYNLKLYKLFNESYIIIFINVIRLERASENKMINKVFNTKPEESRKVGRPRLRWEECVWQDIRISSVRNRRSVTSNGEE